MATRVSGGDAAHSFVELLVRFRFLLGAVGVVLLVAGTRFDSLRGVEAFGLALSLPLVVTLLGTIKLQNGSHRVRLFGLGVSALVLVAAEVEIGHTLFPPHVVSSAELSLAHPDGMLPVPSGHRFDIEAQAALAHDRSAAEGHFALDLERGGEHATMSGEFSRSATVVRGSRRRAPQLGSPHAIDTARDAVDLPGEGPVQVRLTSLHGSVGKVLHVRVLPPVPLGRFLELALFALGAIALGVQTAAARQGVNVSYAGWVGSAIALALYLPHHFSPSDPLGGVFGALLVALAVGGVGGWIAGLVTRRFAVG